MTTTTLPDADRLLQKLADHRQDWRQKSAAERCSYLSAIQTQLLKVSEKWVRVACEIKGLDPQSPLAGEEWLTGPYAIAHSLRLMLETLCGQAASPRTYPRSPDQKVVQVFPRTLFDRVTWLNTHAEVWLQPHQPATQGTSCPAAGRVALVLGAGNITSIAPLDALYKLLVEHQVVLLKMNPILDPLGPILAEALAPLQADGLIEIVYGGAELGRYLCQHPQVDTIHITGSEQTHDRIVWGDGPRSQRPSAPPLTKPITSELGGVTPILVVPGNWSQRDLAFQARHVASMVTHNASFNCVAGQVLVLARHWPLQEVFLNQVRQCLALTPPRTAYYPGAVHRYTEICQTYPQAEPFGQSDLPWTLIPDVPPEAGEKLLTEEAFCGVLGVVNLPVQDAADFLEQAVPFANQTIHGTLACTLLIDPASQRTPNFQQAIADLRYGVIGVNIWPGAAFLMPEIPWGAFPGHTLAEVGSGIGWVHNTCLLEHPQKSVVYSPFHIWPKPTWFSGHRTLRQLGQAALQFEVSPSWRSLVPLLLQAVAG